MTAALGEVAGPRTSRQDRARHRGARLARRTSYADG